VDSTSDAADEADSSSVALLDESDEVLTDVRAAIEDGYAGIILVGPPGTGKSWYAQRIAHTLADGDPDRVRFVQFHASFQYEDFMEGYVPDGHGNFSLRPKHFRLICEHAATHPGQHVLVIDEISRCDAARVFGEALTYIEVTKRGLSFSLASGTSMAVPANVIILATMNPWDRGVDDIDLALERRFCQINMLPRSDRLREILSNGSLPGTAIDAVVRFFDAIQKLPNAMCHIGHAYFVPVRDEASLRRLWRLQLQPHFARAYRLESGELKKVEGMWSSIVEAALAAPKSTPEETSQPSA
jgi:5-methylcytosine-specific restriction protein B